MVRMKKRGPGTLYLYSKQRFDQNRQTEQQGRSLILKDDERMWLWHTFLSTTTGSVRYNWLTSTFHVRPWIATIRKQANKRKGCRSSFLAFVTHGCVVWPGIRERPTVVCSSGSQTLKIKHRTDANVQAVREANYWVGGSLHISSPKNIYRRPDRGFVRTRGKQISVDRG